MLSEVGDIHAADKGDFVIGRDTVVEVGGRSKSGHQIRGRTPAFMAIDDIEVGVGNRIPLWLFGFLY